MALEHSSTLRNSTKANFFSWLMYTLTTLSPGPTTPPICSAAAPQRASEAAWRSEQPAQLPRIARTLADLRGLPLEAIAAATTANAFAALPRLGQLGA